MAKKILVALPPGLLEQVDLVAQVEHRNRSDLIREALRRYTEEFKQRQATQMSVSMVTGSSRAKTASVMRSEASGNGQEGEKNERN